MEIWDLYFAQIVGMMMHPGALKGGPPDLEYAARIASRMVAIRKEVLCR